MNISKPQFTEAEIANLEIAYRQAIYEIYDRNTTIRLKIGDRNLKLELLLNKYNAIGWALITAANPYSQCLSATENKQRHENLVSRLQQLQLTTIPAVGKDAMGEWTPEASLFILNINRCDAIAVGREFQQNAIVYGELNLLPQLIWI